MSGWDVYMGKELSEMTLEELWRLFPIILKEHNTHYKDWYEFEKQKLLNCIDRKNFMRINHIGSTSVEGLMSSENNPYMKMVFNKGYTKDGFAEKVYHLHVRYYDNWDELYFRDYLMEHKEIAKEYGELKLGLITQYEYNRDEYTNAKSNFILKYTQKAKEEYADKYNPRR